MARRSHPKGDLVREQAIRLHRNETTASIVFISAPTEERRKAQEGWDVFKHQVKPATDPDNYKPPTVGAVLGNAEAPVK